MYGWGATSFIRPESQTPHQIPLAYSKGPSDVGLIIVDIIDDEEGDGSVYMNFFCFNIA